MQWYILFLCISFYMCMEWLFKLNDSFEWYGQVLLWIVIWLTCSAISIPFYQCCKSIFKLNDSFEWYGQVELWILYGQLVQQFPFPSTNVVRAYSSWMIVLSGTVKLNYESTCSAISIPFYQCCTSIFKLNDTFEWYGQVELWILYGLLPMM